MLKDADKNVIYTELINIKAKMLEDVLSKLKPKKVITFAWLKLT